MTEPSAIASISAVADRQPDAVAISAASGSMTYAELVAAVGGVAQTLRARGIGGGDRVAIHLDRSSELIIAILGVLAAGAAYVPLDPANPPARLHPILRDCRPRLLIGDATAEPLASGVGVALLGPAEFGPSGATPCDLPVSDRPAYIVYTSGSTGDPKGVVVGCAALANYLDWALAELPFTGGGVPLLASVSFDHAVTCYLPPLMTGETLHLLPPLDGGRALARGLLHGHRYSYVKITPSHARLLDADQRAELGRSTDLVMFGGERLTPDLVDDVRRDVPDLAVMNHYGPTETTVGCCVYRVSAPFARAEVPIGGPIPGVLVRVVRPDLSEASIGEAGELLVGGLALAQGYLGRPEETARAFIELTDHAGMPVRWYRTGDVVRCREAGELDYLGRVDDQVKVLGHRIEPADIEAALRRAPGVTDAVVTAAPTPHGTELVAAVTARAAGVDRQSLLAHLRGLLPAPMIPSRIAVLDALPVTVNGKLDRQALLGATELAPVDRSAVGPSSITAKISELLGAPVGADDDFFESGGDSLAAVELLAWASSAFGVDLELSAVFKYPTARLLAAHIDEVSGRGT